MSKKKKREEKKRKIWKDSTTPSDFFFDGTFNIDCLRDKEILWRVCACVTSFKKIFFSLGSRVFALRMRQNILSQILIFLLK